MPSKKKAAKKAPAKKKSAAKKSSRKSAAPSRASQGGAGLQSLLSKIQLELENGKKRKLSKADIARAQECLSKSGKLMVSFKRASLDGSGGGGTGTMIID